MNLNKRNLSDAISDDEKFINEFQDVAKTVVLSSSLKPLGQNNQFLRQAIGNPKLLKIKDSPQFPDRASAFFKKSDNEEKSISMDSIVVRKFSTLIIIKFK